MKLSIITINYNNIEGLKKTIESVQNQKLQNTHEFEYIVIDGLSIDGSQELIKQSNIITKYKIEKDEGIADAFNKGIKLARGEYLYFLNSGDVFYDDESLNTIVTNINNSPQDIFIYKMVKVDSNENIVNYSNGKFNFKKQILRNYFPHQGMIIKSELFDTYGKYDKHYRLGMDYEWSLRLLKDCTNLNIKFLGNVICKMLHGGVSQTNYAGTFMAYHNARVKHKIMNGQISYLISVFYILKRFVGSKLKGK